MANTFTIKSDAYQTRYMQLTCVQEIDIANNQSEISWTLSSIGGTVNYYQTGPTTVTIGGKQAYYCPLMTFDTKKFPAATGSVSGTVYIDHDVSGEKTIEVSMETNIRTGVLKTYRGSWTLDTIPRKAEITDATDFTDLTSPTVTYSNPAGKSADILQAFIYDTDDSTILVGGKDLEKTGTSQALSLTSEEIETLRNAATGNGKKVWFYIMTVIGGCTYWSSRIERTFSVAETDESRPTVKVTAELNNDSIPDAFAGMYIQGKSRLNVTVTASGNFGASIKSKWASLDGVTYNADSFTSGVIQGAGNVTVTGYAKDSREFTGTDAETIQVMEYAKPYVMPNSGENAVCCYRSDENGKKIGNSDTVWVKAKRFYYKLVSDGVQKNFCSLQWRYKKTSEQWNSSHIWTDLIPRDSTGSDEYDGMISGTSFDLKDAYVIQIRAMDDFGEYDIKTLEIPTQDVALHLGRGGKNVTVGTYCDYERDYTFCSEWDAFFRKNVSVIGSINGVYMDSKYITYTDKLQVKTAHDDFLGNGGYRQSILLFGCANGALIFGVGYIDSAGRTAWSGTSGVTFTAGTDGILEITLPATVFDNFTIISADKIGFVQGGTDDGEL